MTLKVSKNMTGPVGPFTGGIVPDGSTIDTSLQLIITNLIGKESALPTGGLTTQYLRGDKTWASFTKATVGLANVDNTSDANKPVSSAVATALATKEDSLGASTAGYFLRGDRTWQVIGKATVGLANVDNTTDLNKPISTATQTALDGKASTAVVTTTVNGLMAFADKVKLNAIASGATANATDAALRDRSTHTGTQTADTIVETTSIKMMTSAERTKLSGIAASATANDTDVNLKNRANHTGTQAISTITNLQSSLDAKEGTIAAGTTAQFYRGDKTWVSLTKAIVGLANVDNTADIDKPISTAAQAALDLKAGTAVVTTTVNGLMAFTDKVKLDGIATGATANATDAALRARSSHTGTQAISTVTNLQTTLDGKESLANKGVVNGYAPLGADGKVPSINLPDNGSYKGNWNASTNTPTVVAGTGTNGDTYTVSVAGTQSVTGTSTAFAVGDQLKYTTNGNKWERIPNTQAVSSVAGLAGTIAASDLKTALTLAKSDVGLSNVDNTADSAKPISTATQAALDGKEPTIAAGTTSNFWRGDKTWVSITKTTVGLANVDNTSDANKPISTATQTALNAKASTAVATTTVDGLMAFADKAKLNGIATGATANDTDANLKNRSNHTGAQAISTVTGLQAALDGKAPTSLVTAATDGLMAYGDKIKLDGIATSATVNATDAALRDRATHTGAQAISTITNLQSTLDGKESTVPAGTTSQFYRGDKTWVAITKSTVGLSNVDNTSDATKPISTATQTALDNKASTAVVTTTVNGLMAFADKVKLNGIATGATVNDTDANLKARANHTGTQAISTIVNLQTTLDTKEPTVTAGTTAQYYRGDKSWQTLNKSAVGLANVDNTADADKPISTATQSALDTKAVNQVATAVASGLMSSTDKTKLDGLGTASTYNIGTAGAVVPILTTGNTWTGTNSFPAIIQTRVGADVDLNSVMSSDAGRVAGNLLRTSTSNRWFFGKDNSSESGADAGSNFIIRRYTDAGVASSAITISRATGLVTLGTALGISSGGTGATTIAAAKTNLSLNNVDNTSDVNKPVSTAMQTALNSRLVIAFSRAVLSTTPSSASAVWLGEDGRQGLFTWWSGNSSAMVTADPAQAMVVAPSSDTTGVSGVWRRTISAAEGYDPKWFGAVGDGTTSDTVAFQRLASYINYRAEPAKIKLGRNRYYLTDQVEFKQSIDMVGEGQNSSEVLMEGSSRFFFNGESGSTIYSARQFHLRMFRIIQSGINTGLGPLAIGFDASADTRGTIPGAIIEDIEIVVKDNTSSWTNAFWHRDIPNLRVKRMRIEGARVNPLVCNRGIQHTSTAGGASDCVYEDLACFFVQDALTIDPDVEVEGVNVVRPLFIACRRGFVWLNTVSNFQPALWITDGHMNCEGRNIDIANVTEFHFRGMEFYGQGVDGSTTEHYAISSRWNPTGGGRMNGHITCCVFQGDLNFGEPSSRTTRAINISGGSASVENCVISGNIFQTYDSGVVLDANTNGVSVTDDNQFTNCTENVADYSPNGSNIIATLVQSGTHWQRKLNDGFIMKSGTAVITLDSSGNGVIPLNSAGPVFPNSVLPGVIVSNGDPGTSGSSIFSSNHGATTTSQIVFSVRPNPGAITVRVQYQATGR